MFVTILTIIYLALALFILGRFIKRKSDLIEDWRNQFTYRFKRIFLKTPETNQQGIDEISSTEASDEIDEQKLQPEYKKIWD